MKKLPPLACCIHQPKYRRPHGAFGGVGSLCRCVLFLVHPLLRQGLVNHSQIWATFFAHFAHAPGFRIDRNNSTATSHPVCGGIRRLYSSHPTRFSISFAYRSRQFPARSLGTEHTPNRTPAYGKQNVFEGVPCEVLGRSSRPQVRLAPPVVVVRDEEIRLSLALRPRGSSRLAAL